jgi:phospho-N-acetylmuramoyl-pentapeptide-transferase
VAATLSLFAICAVCPVAASSFRHDLAPAGIGEVGVFLAAISGACLGFLWYNRHPAKLFMGDVGSLALGGVLGVSAIFLREEFLLGLVGAVFVAEALSVIAQVICFRLTGKRVLLCSPLHHHFEYKGMAETKIVSYFWIVTVVLCLVGLMTLL